MEGIDYWKDLGKDPYEIAGVEQTERMRGLLKLILLNAINAKDKASTIKAVRWETNKNPEEYGWTKEEEIDLGDLIDRFALEHCKIGKHFFSGIGIKLQHLDSLVAEQVINWMTQRGLPVLCIHDSFIIQSDEEKLLRSAMQSAYELVVASGFLGFDEKTQAKVKDSGVSSSIPTPIDKDGQKTPRDDGYFKRLRTHRALEWTDYYEPDIPFKGSGISGLTIRVS